MNVRRIISHQSGRSCLYRNLRFGFSGSAPLLLSTALSSLRMQRPLHRRRSSCLACGICRMQTAACAPSAHLRLLLTLSPLAADVRKYLLANMAREQMNRRSAPSVGRTQHRGRQWGGWGGSGNWHGTNAGGGGWNGLSDAAWSVSF